MFRQGKSRTFAHNLRLASMLSFVAGIVNINGVLAISTLTSNVTGHFAFFAEDFLEGRYDLAVHFLIYVLFFLMGAFACGFLVEWVVRRKPDIAHALPMFIEVTILIAVAFAGAGYQLSDEAIASALLFAMGLQNALVTKISKATVRTTHLTGLFTDLGIELSQLFFYRAIDDAKVLLRSIFLRLTIIIFFFLGGVLGGITFHHFGLKALLLAAGWLVVALLYDNIRFGVHYYIRKFRGR